MEITEQNITDIAAERWSAAHEPRLAQIMQTLVRYLHDYARTVGLTEPEWREAVGWLSRTGRIGDDKREDFILASDVLGLSMLIVDGSPAFEFGADMSSGVRGKYVSTSTGAYCVRTIAPVGYSIPMDGPVGELISHTDISHYRPAHVHVVIDVPGCDPLITHLFPKGAQFLDSDAVFSVKNQLIVDFERRAPGPTPDGGVCKVPWLFARYDFVLQPPNPSR